MSKKKKSKKDLSGAYIICLIIVFIAICLICIMSVKIIKEKYDNISNESLENITNSGQKIENSLNEVSNFLEEKFSE